MEQSNTEDQPAPPQPTSADDATPPDGAGNPAQSDGPQSAGPVPASKPAIATPAPSSDPGAKDAAPPQPQVHKQPLQRRIVLKNARADEPYATEAVLDDVTDLVLVDAASSGISFDSAAGQFIGLPATPGDFDLKLTGQCGGRPIDITATLSVIPDPKSLWTSQPSDQKAPGAKPDEAFCVVEGEGLRLVAASKRGRSHAKNGGFREDDLALAVHGPWHIAAVADGAGSARFSRMGSRIAVQTVTQILPSLLDKELGDDLHLLVQQIETRTELVDELRRRLYETLVASAFRATEAIEREAELLSCKAADLSTTLIVLVARKLEAKWFVAAFSIGDGGAAVLDVEGPWVQPLTSPDSGEYAGQTRFLARSEFSSFEDASKRLHFSVRTNFTAIALMTDGITDPKLPTDKVFADSAAWASFWNDDLRVGVDFAAEKEALEASFLSWLDFWSPGNHDDRTLAILLPIGDV